MKVSSLQWLSSGGCKDPRISYWTPKFHTGSVHPFVEDIGQEANEELVVPLGTRESTDISQLPRGAGVEVTPVSLELSGNKKL